MKRVSFICIFLTIAILFTGCSKQVKDTKEFEPYEFIERYIILLADLEVLGNQHDFNTQNKQLNKEQLNLVRNIAIKYTTERFFENQLRPILPSFYDGTDLIELPHNLFPELRLTILEEKEKSVTFETLMLSNNHTTSGGLVRFTAIKDGDVWKLDKLVVAPPNFNLTNEEVRRLYPNQSFTIVEEPKEDILVFSITVEGIKKCFKINRDNGQIAEVEF